MYTVNNSEIKKILCIKPRGIGDIILSTIVLENLKNYFKESEIHYLTEEFAKEAVITNPLVIKVLTLKRDDSIISIVKKIRKERYDVIFDFWSNPRTAQLTFFSGARLRVGYGYRGRKFAYNNKAMVGRGDVHSAEHNLELLKIIGIPIISRKIKFYIDSESEKFANSLLKSKKNILIGILPSGGWNSKRCPKEKWIEIIKVLRNKINSDFLILWGKDDKNDAEFIALNSNDVAKLAPETSLLQMAAIMSKCDLIIANDSGPMHLAAALGVPTLGLFGPTDPKKHGPYSENSDYVILSDLHCIICNKLECPYKKECFYLLDSELIASKSLKLLNKNAEKI